MEFLLVNHPLDCPICDQGGECDLQVKPPLPLAKPLCFFLLILLLSLMLPSSYSSPPFLVGPVNGIW